MTQLTLLKHTNLRRALLVGAALTITAAVSSAFFGYDLATADPAPTPTTVAGNPNTCAEAGLSGTILFGDGDPSYPPPGVAGSATAGGVGQTTLSVMINAGFTASGIVVKGAPMANIYTGPFVGPITIEGMTAPENNGMFPAISHWFVCGTTTPISISPGGGSLSPSPVVAPSESPVTPGTTAAVPSGPARTGGGGSQEDFPWGGVLALLVVALPVAGAFLLRRRDEASQE